TPKAFANPSPGFERSENPGIIVEKTSNPERVRLAMNPFRVNIFFLFGYPGFSLSSNPGLGLANAFGVRIQLASRLLTDISSEVSTLYLLRSYFCKALG